MKSDPHVKVGDPNPFHYCLESTAQYHVVVLKSWLGEPELINPLLAGATLKKTDVADASKLAKMDLSGVWRSFFVPSDEISTLRALLAERSHYGKLATQIGNRINSLLLRFGITIGREGSVTKSSAIREIVEEELISDSFDAEKLDISLCPDGLPDDVKTVIQEEYEAYDRAISMRDEYTRKSLENVRLMSWETRSDVLSGERMLSVLTSVPGIGDQTACIWLANIITPRRFLNAKACAAYCGLDPSVQISAKHVTGKKMRKGNKDLHSSLTLAASNLINKHHEPFGIWGYQLYLQTGRWKKATNAVARRLAVSLYYVQLLGEDFSYDKYNLINEKKVIDISIDDLAKINPGFKRYINILKENNIETTSQMASSYYSFNFAKIKGVGKKFYGLVKEFIDKQDEYKIKYDELCNGVVYDEGEE